MIEGIFAARNTGAISFAAIQNQSCRTGRRDFQGRADCRHLQARARWES